MNKLYEEIQLVLETEQGLNEAHRRTYTVHKWHGDETQSQQSFVDTIDSHGGDFVPIDDTQGMVRWSGPEVADKAEEDLKNYAHFDVEHGG